jgi:SHAQKYF class myb-like DNA-binding protein
MSNIGSGSQPMMPGGQAASACMPPGPGTELSVMAQAAWHHQQQEGPGPAALSGPPIMEGQPQGPAGPAPLSLQAELELELSLRGSLLVQQQRRIVQLEDELHRAWQEIEKLRAKICNAERDRQQRNEDIDLAKQPRYWTPEEHRKFTEAVARFGWKDVKSIAAHVGSRTPTQVRTHAQKLFLRQQKETTGAPRARSPPRPPPPTPLRARARGGHPRARRR